MNFTTINQIYLRKAFETPLIDHLRSIPEGLRAEWPTQWFEDGELKGQPCGHRMAPVGRYVKEAVERIAELEKQAACTHHFCSSSDGVGVSQYSPFMHAWRCDLCGHIKQDS